MVERQLRRRGIRDARVLDAMSDVPREFFVPAERRKQAYDDDALPLGYGQTISQPYVVAAMCELLGLTGDERVLEVGTGSGYAAAVLDELAAHVVTVELIPELAAAARSALDETGHGDVEVRTGDGSLGDAGQPPFDAILVSAAAPELPLQLLDRLTDAGRMVCPVGPQSGQRLVVVERRGNETTTTAGLRCRFVPLRGAAGYPE